MGSLNAAVLINLLGFMIGIALYILLAMMVLRHRSPKMVSKGASKVSVNSGMRGRPERTEDKPEHKEEYIESVDTLLLATAALGLIWNIGELAVLIYGDFAVSGQFPLVTAAAYSALGFLPSVVVHSAEKGEGRGRLITLAAYGISIFAALLHFRAAFSGAPVPSSTASSVLIVGAVSLAVGLFAYSLRQALEKKAVWLSALLIFALSGLHFFEAAESRSWLIELVAHQSSLPLALVILYQNYRFAFADKFLKRAISVLFLGLVAFAAYTWIAAPLLRYHETHDRNDVQAIAIILVLWMGTALTYPFLHDLAVWLVDKVILHRADYARLQAEMAGMIETLETPKMVLDSICGELSRVLTAGRVTWSESDVEDDGPADEIVAFTPFDAEIAVKTAELPHYRIMLGDFHGGRTLLSEETEMLRAVSRFAARRIDAIRVSHERCEQELREQEFSKLAAEAQLTALRAQINPHFLFNALTTIGYLIQTAPEKAFQTLLQLTKLLRSVLNSTSELCPLGDEIKLIESYLDIERARFEERLKVSFDIQEETLALKIPALVLQPLVENAIKHGISESRSGGEVKIAARLASESIGTFLDLSVTDTGNGKPLNEKKATGGVGLRNIRERLRTHYGTRAALVLHSNARGEVMAKLHLPVDPVTLQFAARATSRGGGMAI